LIFIKYPLPFSTLEFLASAVNYISIERGLYAIAINYQSTFLEVKSLDTLEQYFINSPLKKVMQKHFELAVFKKFLRSNGRVLARKTLLDAGCGSGYGLKLLREAFHPRELFGLDILPREVQLARLQDTQATVLLRDVVHTSLPPATFDAVFIFTMLHHVPQWREGLQEMSRILKPHGLLLVDELNKELVLFFQQTMGIKHPKEAQFEWPEFVQGLNAAGFKIIDKLVLFNRFGLFLCEKMIR